jgi:alkanesulfonate monooxygenase SsuD/methylene tetrahydromethanopterin reductase-like flavin-dependent oxidoreductase (luciferase family)
LKNVALAAEIADGWMPIFFSPYRADVYKESLAGTREGFEIACPVTVILGDDVQAALMTVKWYLAFYIGGMGAPEANFHFDLVSRFGFHDQAEHVRKLFLEGRREEAAAAVPNDLADEISLIGPPARIKDRLRAWIDSPVTQLLAGTRDPAALRALSDSLR